MRRKRDTVVMCWGSLEKEDPIMTMETARTELAAIDTALGALAPLDHAGRCRAMAYLISALGVAPDLELARAIDEAEAQGLITSS